MMIIVNIAVIVITTVVMYKLITYAERKFNLPADIARDLSGK